MRVLSLLGATALATAFAASAAPAPQEANAAYDAQDIRLNAAYKKLSQSLDDAGRKALRNEERQWIIGRDTACKVSAGNLVKNECTTTQTSFRADELEKRLGGSTSLAGEWAYRSDCGFGHHAEMSLRTTAPQVEGTWSDGSRKDGSQGQLKGQWRDGKLFVRFCTEDSPDGSYPACPAFSDVSGYLVPYGGQLVWYRTSGMPAEGKFNKYLVLGRKPNGGDVPKDTKCDSDR
ncbi:lysozyme inhibitor LprI family protein [Luteibacter pinisoli]|nr:lysozyme inhibitor LprI family protein [Luteibacter pinisoli]